MIIRYSDGSYAHGVICSLTGATLGAAVAGVDEAVEFRLLRGAWTTGRGLVVTFEFPHEAAAELLRTMGAMNLGEEEGDCAAGGDCVLRRMADPGGRPVN
jgi:hypothetical protein